jgi:hypothetical protein
MVTAFGQASRAIFMSLSDVLYVNVEEVTPTMSGLRLPISLRNSSMERFSIWQSMTSTW